MPEKKLCPLLLATTKKSVSLDFARCQQENCAWWDDEIKECVIVNLQSLVTISSHLDGIKRK